MKILAGILIVISISVPLISCAQHEQALGNPDFEQPIDSGYGYGKWTTPAAEYMPNYKVELRANGAFSGKQYAEIRSTGDPGPREFGNLMQYIDATPYRGKTMRFRAAVKVSPETNGQAQLWMRVDRVGKKMGFFDNMDDRPITDSAWQPYEIVGTIDSDAVGIAVGCMLIGVGSIGFDDASLEVIDAPATAYQPPKALDDRSLQNLIAFAKLYGYVRFFHPTDAVAHANWDNVALLGVTQIERAKDASELAGLLQNYFKPLSLTLRVFPSSQVPTVPTELLSPPQNSDTYTVAWVHNGVGLDKTGRSIYRSDRETSDGRYYDNTPGHVQVDERPAFPDVKQPELLALGAGVSCLLPIALYPSQVKSVRAKGDYLLPASFHANGADRTTRLADVIIAWNILQHFFPYFDVVKTDWNAALRSALLRAAEDKTSNDFVITLEHMIAALHDGHGHVYCADAPTAYAPFAATRIGNDVVVTDLVNGYHGALTVGDLIREIDHKPIATWLSVLDSVVSAATPQYAQYRVTANLFATLHEDSVRMTVVDASGRTKEITEHPGGYPEFPPMHPGHIYEVKPGIMYVNIDRATRAEFDEALPHLAKAKAILFDLRGYPRELFTEPISHMIDTMITCARWNVPVVMYPDGKNWKWNFSNWTVTPAEPRFTKNIVHLTDGRAISAAETYMGMIEAYHIGSIVGDATAGTNGNINPFSLPGRYQVTWTGMKVLKHDGSQHHGIGIKPTVHAERTVAGIREGRDEVLERGILQAERMIAQKK